MSLSSTVQSHPAANRRQGLWSRIWNGVSEATRWSASKIATATKKTWSAISEGSAWLAEKTQPYSSQAFWTLASIFPVSVGALDKATQYGYAHRYNLHRTAPFWASIIAGYAEAAAIYAGAGFFTNSFMVQTFGTAYAGVIIASNTLRIVNFLRTKEVQPAYASIIWTPLAIGISAIRKNKTMADAIDNYWHKGIASVKHSAKNSWYVMQDKIDEFRYNLASRKYNSLAYA